MDFLVTSGNLGERLAPTHLHPYQLDKSTGPLECFRRASLMVFAPAGFTRSLLAGYAICGGRMFHQNDAAFSSLPPLTCDAHGVYALLRVSPEGEAFAQSDITGQYPLFYATDGGSFLSNNCHLIERALLAIGRRPMRSTIAIAQSLGYGTPMGSASAVTGIQLVPPRHEVRITPEGVMTLHERCAAASVYQSDDDYASLIAQAEEDMRTVAGAVMDCSASRILCDLTGGADSRLALAALLSTGASARDRIEVFCISNYPAADRIVADHIAYKYGLRGANVPSDNQTEYLPPDRTIRRGLFRTFGLKLSDQTDVGHLRFPSLCRVSGYFGEMSRSFGTTVRTLPRNGMELATRYFSRRDARSMLLTDDARQEIIAAMAAQADRLLEAGCSASQLLKILYCENRCRYHFGLPSRLSNDVRIAVSPLYSVRAIRAASRLSYADLANNRAGFDLISRLAGTEFALEPRAESRWSPSLVPAAWAEPYLAIPTVRAGGPRLAPELAIHLDRGYRRPARENQSQYQRAMAERGRSSRFLNVPLYQAMVTELIGDMAPSEELWRWLDRDQILAVAKAEPSDIEAGACGSNGRLILANQLPVVAGLLWYNREEEACSVE